MNITVSLAKLVANMSGFNTSTRREDISMRLRAQNLRNVRDQTKRLEEDSRKMEDRLKELKTAMKREKEERERLGGGFWGRGQASTGSLSSYAAEVLKSKVDKPVKEGKIRKIKVLQDEPLEKPKQIGQPGTMKYIAQRNLTSGATPRDKQKGPKCGQCEDRTATLNCVQCSEIYCPGCFAAFHLKGALKQHRSVPLSAAGPRVCMSPRTSVDSLPARGSQASGSLPVQSYSGMNGAEAAGPASVQPAACPSLLRGDYDETQSAASFQAALMAWRQGEQAKPVSHSPYSVDTAPVSVVDESTDTAEEAKIPEIKFKSSLSYAEKLLLKKHWRMKSAETSSDTDSQCQSRSMVTPLSDTGSRCASRLHSPGSFSRSHTALDSSTDTGDEGNSFMDDDYQVDFQSLFEAVALSELPDRTSARATPASSHASVCELFTDEKPMGTDAQSPKTSATYIVKEVSPMESWKTELQLQSGSPASVTSRQSRFIPPNSYFSRKAHTGVRSGLLQLDSRTSEALSASAVTSSHDQHHGHYLSISEHSDGNTVISSMSVLGKSKYELSKQQSATEISDLDSTQSSTKLEIEPQKLTSRPKSAKSRPGSAKTKMTKKSSRTSSRTGGEGLLTKLPTEALRRVAKMAQSPQYSYASQSPLERFFLAGLEGKQSSEKGEKVMSSSTPEIKTPRSKSRGDAADSARQEVIKISNRLYQMAPRSWRPESSLGSTVALNKLDGQEVTLSFTYSGHVNGQGIEWHQFSNQDRNERPDSALLFGDEMFIAEAAAASSAQSPSEHGQGDHTHYEATENSSRVPLSPSNQLLRKSGGRRLHHPVTPASGSDLYQGFKMKPVPPAPIRPAPPAQPRQGARLSDPGKYKLQSEASNHYQNSITPSEKREDKSRASKDDEFKLFKQNTRSSNGAEFLKSSTSAAEMQNSEVGKNLVRVKNNTNSAKKDQIKTKLHAHIAKNEMSVNKLGFSKLNRDSGDLPSKFELKSDRRPTSSTTLPTHSTGQILSKSSGEMRPNSCTGGSEPARRTKNSLSSDTQSYGGRADSVLTDAWTVDENCVIYDYDDGDEIIPACMRVQHMRMMPKPNVKDSINWETEVRPFSGISIDSRTGDSQSKEISKGDKEKSKKPLSSRSVSVKSGRISRAIVVDGDDFSCFDAVGTLDEQNMEDKQTLDQLEWELTSNTGRLADHQISHTSVLDIGDVGCSSLVTSKGKSLGMSSEKEYDIAAKLLEDENLAERSVECFDLRRSSTVDEEEVRALR